jgi:Putative amidoligase enzyme/Protein of unknown function (DUF3489)
MTDFSRTYGVEIECLTRPGVSQADVARAITAAGVLCEQQPYGHTVPRGKWKIVHDGSLNDHINGMEVVSPPLSGEAGMREIEIVAATLARLGTRIKRECGLHVHVDARRPELSLDGFKRLALLYIENESFIDSVMPPSRRGTANRWAQSIAHIRPEVVLRAHDVNALASALLYNDNRARRGEHARDSRRYVKLNFLSFLKYGTVEFRHHGGSIDGKKIQSWVRFCLGMVSKAAAAPTATVLHDVQQMQRITRRVRQGSKRAIVYNMLIRPEGCTTAEVLAATGWRQVSVAGIAHQYGLTVRQQREGYPRETRYFGTHAPVDTTAPVVSSLPAPAPESKPRNIAEFAAYISLSDEDRAFWTARAELFSQPMLPGTVTAE